MAHSRTQLGVFSASDFLYILLLKAVLVYFLAMTIFYYRGYSSVFGIYGWYLENFHLGLVAYLLSCLLTDKPTDCRTQLHTTSYLSWMTARRSTRQMLESATMDQPHSFVTKCHLFPAVRLCAPRSFWWFHTTFQLPRTVIFSHTHALMLQLRPSVCRLWRSSQTVAS